MTQKRQKKRLSCATNEWPDSLHQPGTEREVYVGRNTQQPHQTQTQKLRIRVLCHNRAGAGQSKQEHITPRPQNAENVRNKPIRIPPRPPKHRKTKNYRAQRRCENQLPTAAPRESSTPTWNPCVHALANLVELSSKSWRTPEKEEA